MSKKINNQSGDDHDHLRADKVTRNKINKHLSDINDTISEDDMKNIDTSTFDDTSKLEAEKHTHKKDDADMNKDETSEHPNKEMPTSWDIIT